MGAFLLALFSLIGTIIAILGMMHNFGDPDNQDYFTAFCFLAGFDLIIFILCCMALS